MPFREGRSATMLRATGITKTFPGVKSLDRVDFAVEGGEIHALVGENGAGKSTLIKILSGAYVPDEGKVEFDGRVVAWTGPRQAQEAGIHVIYQELVLFPELSVAENIFIYDQPLTRLGFLDYPTMERRAEEALDRLGVHIDVRSKVANLSIADQQMAEIARALVGSVKILVLDEPTAVISGREVELLFERLVALRASGVAIVYISHRLDEIFQIADRVTVLKDGQLVGTWPVRQVDHDRLISLMVGRPLSDVFPPRRPIRPEAEFYYVPRTSTSPAESKMRALPFARVRYWVSPVLWALAGLNWLKPSTAAYPSIRAKSSLMARSLFERPLVSRSKWVSDY